MEGIVQKFIIYNICIEHQIKKSTELEKNEANESTLLVLVCLLLGKGNWVPKRNIHENFKYRKHLGKLNLTTLVKGQ